MADLPTPPSIHGVKFELALIPGKVGSRLGMHLLPNACPLDNRMKCGART